MKLIDISTFNDNLKDFNNVLVNNINVVVKNSYVRDCQLGRYIFMCLCTSEGILDLTISYDSFYQVPVIYFLLNGQLLPYRSSLVEIHPILQSPYQMLHPCETQDLMATTNCESAIDFLVSWFGLHIEQIVAEIQLRVPSVQAATEVRENLGMI